MKYAVINERGGINRISATEITSNPEGTTVVELTDEQAAQVEAGRSSTPRVHYFFINGELKTGEQRRAALEAERFASLSPADKIKAAERHVLKYFTPLGVIAAQNKMLTVQQAGTEADNPKLVATYQWLLGVQQQAVEGTNGVFPEPPYTFDEVIAE
jgi:hypothetical protein